MASIVIVIKQQEQYYLIVLLIGLKAATLDGYFPVYFQKFLGTTFL